MIVSLTAQEIEKLGVTKWKKSGLLAFQIVAKTGYIEKPEDYWSCIAHLIADEYAELEQTWKYISTQCCISFHPCRSIQKQI